MKVEKVTSQENARGEVDVGAEIDIQPRCQPREAHSPTHNLVHNRFSGVAGEVNLEHPGGSANYCTNPETQESSRIAPSARKELEDFLYWPRKNITRHAQFWRLRASFILDRHCTTLGIHRSSLCLWQSPP